MNASSKKPYVIYIAEIIYSHISIIKKKNSDIDTKNAIKRFMKTNEFDNLSSGELHNKWFIELKKNDYIDKESGKKIPEETIKLLEFQRDATVKQLIKIPELYETENNTMIEVSNRAYQFLWRMCESYELWCKETNQIDALSLNITS